MICWYSWICRHKLQAAQNSPNAEHKSAVLLEEDVQPSTMVQAESLVQIWPQVKSNNNPKEVIWFKLGFFSSLLCILPRTSGDGSQSTSFSNKKNLLVSLKGS